MSKEYRRVAKEDVVSNANKSGFGGDYFKLPEGVRLWKPEKVGSYELDFLPYIVTSENHPDKIEAGMLWYKLPFQVYHKIGPSEESIVSPATFGMPCPITEWRQKLFKDKDKNEQLLKDTAPQTFVAFVIKDPDDEDKIAIFAESGGKFWSYKGGGLKKELQSEGERVAAFWDVTDEGMTLKCRFGEETFSGNKYLQVNKIDFNPRPAMDEDEVIPTLPKLDDLLIIYSYEKIQKMFLQVGSDGESKTSGRAPGKPSEKKTEDKPAEKKTEAKPKEPEKDDEKSSGKFKVGDRVKFKNEDDEVIVGKITDIDGEDVEIEDDKGDDHDAELDDLEPADDEKPTKKDKTPKPAEKSKKDDDDKIKVEYVVGDKIRTDEGVVGIIEEIDDDDVTIVKEDGKKDVIDLKDIEVLVKSAKSVAQDTEKTEKKKESTKELKVGDKVTYDDGDEEGEITKVKPEEGKVKIKDKKSGETVWWDAKDVALKK